MLKMLRRLIMEAPENRWNADILFVPLAVFLGVWIGAAPGRRLLGIGVAAVVLALREVLYHVLVRRRR